MKLRYEDFGAIIALDDPPALVHVDHDMVAALGYAPSPLRDRPLGHLSAPTEVHLLTTERCPAGCPSCYVDATMRSPEPDTAALRDVLERLASFGVFHVAMGGGESLLRDDLFELAAYARELGMTPNLTTSGIGLTDELAARCTVFGQVNTSFDGVGEIYRASRGYDGAEIALRALRRLRDAGVPCGVNTVVSRSTFEHLVQTVAAAAEAGAEEVELLRFKPTGRGALTWLAERLTEAQGRALMPTVLELQRRHPDVTMKIDCSFVPMLCAAEPDPEALAALGVIGCEAGNVMAAVRADLQATACSFVDEPIGDVAALVDGWRTDPELIRWRGYADAPPEPCASCRYRTLCRGGCKAVTRRVDGTWFGPDPDCPRVAAYRRGEPFVPVELP